jgi:regulator of sigma D
MALFLPQGAPPELLHAPHFHLFELLIVKLSRFAKSNLSHADSIHDAAIYAAMIQTALENQDSTQQAASKND